VPKRQSFGEALQVMESLTSLRPQIVQGLLENCTSIKTKRLFMHTAEQLNHAWYPASIRRESTSGLASGQSTLVGDLIRSTIWSSPTQMAKWRPDGA